jgi:hypothetical protein
MSGQREFLEETSMKILKALVTVACVFAPFIMTGLWIAYLPKPALALHAGGLDWMWFIMLGLMMVWLYYFLAVYVPEENEIVSDFAELDSDHDGYIARGDVSGWRQLSEAFDKFDADHDGRLSRIDFERFEHSLPR